MASYNGYCIAPTTYFHDYNWKLSALTRVFHLASFLISQQIGTDPSTFFLLKGQSEIRMVD
jgi:hypothetical protein